MEVEVHRLILTDSRLMIPALGRADGRIDVALVVDEALQNQDIDIARQESRISILWGTHYRLPTNVEACVHEYGTACQFVKGLEQRVETRVSSFAHGLDARAVIDMRDRRNLRVVVFPD